VTDNIEDPFGSPEVDEDPFATAEDVKARRAFVPTPNLEALDGRLLVMVPRKFEENAPKNKAFIKPGEKETQNRYTVDLVCLSGGPLTFWYNAKVEGKTEKEPKEHTIDTLPQMWEDVWRTEAAIVGQLRKVDGTRRPMLLGRLKRGPQSADRDKKNFATIAEEFAAWEKRGRKGASPKFSWQVDVDITPEDKALAMKWYASAVEDGFKL